MNLYKYGNYMNHTVDNEGDAAPSVSKCQFLLIH